MDSAFDTQNSTFLQISSPGTPWPLDTPPKSVCRMPINGRESAVL